MNSRSNTIAARKTLLHIEQDPLTTTYVRQVINGSPEIRHVGVVGTGREGIESCQQKRPDIVLLGPLIPDIDAFTVVEKLAQLPVPPRVLLFTSLADEALFFQIGRSAIDGVVWKTRHARRELLDAIAALLSGRTYFPTTVREGIRNARCRADAFGKFLSDRELELLPLLGRGLSDAELATHTGIAVSTVHSHRQRIMAKLNLHTTVELMRWAVEKGFVRFARPAAPCCIAD